MKKGPRWRDDVEGVRMKDEVKSNDRMGRPQRCRWTSVCGIDRKTGRMVKCAWWRVGSRLVVCQSRLVPEA